MIFGHPEKALKPTTDRGRIDALESEIASLKRQFSQMARILERKGIDTELGGGTSYGG